MTSKPGSPTLSSKEFALVRSFVRQQAGIHIHDDAARQVERRLRPRLEALGLASFTEYYRLLLEQPEHGEELQRLWEVVTNRETYLFREDYQLRAFRDELLVRLTVEVQPRRRLVCWSLGCATGEEAYSIAIVLLESGLVDGWDVRVVGSDICRASVATARRGVYDDNAFRSTTPERRARFFQHRHGRLHVAPSVRALCQFAPLNLMSLPRRAAVEQVDAVFCRNVLIYFAPDARLAVLDAIYERLRPGGLLLLGHAESLLSDATRFEVVHVGEDLVYRRPHDSLTAPTGTPTPAGHLPPSRP